MTPFVYIVPLKTLKVNVKSVKINNKLESNMLNKNRKVAFHTLGCKVNSYETEAMRNQLEQNGYEIADFKPGADIYIINTCTVTNIADRKSRQMLHKAKKMNKDAVVIAVGCYVQAAGEELLKDEAIDIVVGSNRKSEIVHIIEEYYAGKDHSYLSDISKSCEYDDMEMSSLAERTRAFIKIQDGCNQFCTYCIIPKLRGPYRSVPMEELIAEAKTMAEQGVKELVLVAQETTIYGIDLYGKPSLHLLLKELCKIQELYWIRILYCYPEDIYPELVQTMKEEPKVCHYLDLPIQHANDEILRRMGRRTSKQELIDKIDFLRSEMPDITLRTTLITGFPGETKEQHKELLEFINDMEFDRLGVFTYSPEEGTPAATMEHQIDEEVKLDRQAELMELQQDISAELGERRIGQELLVMIEGKVADEDAYVGRSQADAPGVDGYVFVNTPETLVSGDFVRVKITGALEYDLIGEISQ